MASKQERDKISQAVLNTDKDTLAQYKAARARVIEQKNLVKDLAEMKNRLVKVEALSMETLAVTKEILAKLNG